MFPKFSPGLGPPSYGKAFSDKTVDGRPCDQEGCADEGNYRAPKSRYHLESGANDWRWFCLIHVRDYNARWNYYNHMSEREIERECRADAVWQRPSWPLGAQGDARRFQSPPSPHDPFGLFTQDFSSSPFISQPKFSPQSPEGKALSLFGLSFPFAYDDLRKRYRNLVKKHHPDAHGGSREAEEMLKRINEAYDALKELP